MVCTYNGARTLARHASTALRALDYPDYEVIVVDDGSTDAHRRDRRELRRPRDQHRRTAGSSARATPGCEAATGEIVAYIDDDAHPDPHWLTLPRRRRFMTHRPRRRRRAEHRRRRATALIADCVANAPGGPSHVLLSDDESPSTSPAATWRSAATRCWRSAASTRSFRTAGDDVDVCWRLQERGWTIGFSAGRDGLAPPPQLASRAYWQQQRGYGQAEALLERKWPEQVQRGRARRAGPAGSTARGRSPQSRSRAAAIYHGHVGHRAVPVGLPAGAGTAGLAAADAGVVSGRRVLRSCPLGGRVAAAAASRCSSLLAVGRRSVRARGLAARRATAASRRGGARAPSAHAMLTALLHLVQPAARLRGRLASRAHRRGDGAAVPVVARPRRAASRCGASRGDARSATSGTGAALRAAGFVVAARRRLRPLGPGGPRRAARPRPPRDGRRGARPRAAALAVPGLALLRWRSAGTAVLTAVAIVAAIDAAPAVALALRRGRGGIVARGVLEGGHAMPPSRAAAA